MPTHAEYTYTPPNVRQFSVDRRKMSLENQAGKRFEKTLI